MAIQRGPEVWESATDELRLRRSIESLEGTEHLVELVFENTTDTDIVGRVLEDLPLTVTGATLVVAPGGDPDSWRQFEEWIVHEPRIPAGTERTVAYVLDNDTESGLRLPPPRIRSVKPADGETASDVASPAGPSAAPAQPVRESAGAGATAAPSTPAGSTPGQTMYGEALLDQLLAALERKELDDQRRELQSKLGLAPSERARFEYVTSRLDDLAAYVDALEGLVDDHGIDVIAELQETVDRNEERTAAVEQALDAMEGDLERYRADADREIGLLRSYITDLDADVEDRFVAIEKKTDRLERAVSTAREQRRADRQALARELRDMERSQSSLADSLTELDEQVRELEEFRERFAAVCTSKARPRTRD